MENCIFYIPNDTPGKIKIKNYQSPNSSPTIQTERVRRDYSISSADTFFMPQPHHRSRNSADYSQTNKYKETQFKLKSITDLLSTTKITPSPLSDLNSLSSTVHFSETTFKDHTQTKNKIKECESEILVLKSKLLKLTNINGLKAHKVQLEEIQLLTRQNEEIHSKIKTLKNDLKKFKKNSVPNELFWDLKKVYRKFEDKNKESLDENARLQMALRVLKKENLENDYNNLENSFLIIKTMLIDILKFDFLVSGYLEKKEINLAEMINKEFGVNCGNMTQYIERVKKAVEVLRKKSTDLYAEICGSNCSMQ